MAVRSLGAGSAVRVTREYLALDDPRIGVTYGSTDDQGGKIQAALDLAVTADGGCVFVDGVVYSHQELVWPIGRYTRLLGAGAGDWINNSPAAIVFPNDLGAGSYALRVPLNSEAYRIEKLGFFGPASSNTIGDMPADMYGFYTPTRGSLEDVTIRGFGAGVGLINDHQEFHSCDFRGNGYGIDHMDNPAGGLGDLLFFRCFLTDQLRASIAVASTNSIANAWYTQGHCGAAPFGIYRYQALVPATGSNGNNQLTGVDVAYTPTVGMTVHGPQSAAETDSTSPIPAGTTITNVAGTAGNWTLTMSANANGAVTQVELARRGTVVQGVTFNRHSFEYCGNAMFYDEVGGGSWEFVIDGNAEFGTGGSAKWPGKPTPMANIHADSVDGTWRGNAPSPQSDAPLQPYVSAKSARVRIENPQTFFDAVAVSGHKSFKVRDGGLGDKYNDCLIGQRVPGSGGIGLSMKIADETIAKGTLLEECSDIANVRAYRSAATPGRVCGVALADYDPGDVVVYATQGQRNGLVVRNSSGSTITNQALLKPDPAHNGCVTAATGPTDGPIVGRAHDGNIASGGTGPASVWIS